MNDDGLEKSMSNFMRRTSDFQQARSLVPQKREPDKGTELGRRLTTVVPSPLIPPPRPAVANRPDITTTDSGGPGGNFCEVFELEGTWYIRGGLVRVSTTKSFNIPDYEIATGTDGVKLIYIELDVEANRDDDGDYFLPGLKTSSETAPEMEDTASADYPAGTEPDIATGLGTIILEVGALTVTDSIPTLAATGCGPFFLSQCAGNLSYSPRG